MEPTLRLQVNQQLASSLCRPLEDYDSVQVFVFYWESSDNPGFQKEALEICTFFESDLGYPVRTFLIPNRKCQLRLDAAINALLDIPENQKTLLIVHYGGHGDADSHGDGDKPGERRSILAACEKDGPTLNWSKIQAKFDDTTADVLVLLDCCYGAQAARGREQTMVNKVELLTASSMGVKAAPPGPTSFTSACIKEMKRMLRTDGYIVIHNLAMQLMKRETGLLATPVHTFIKCKGYDRSIHLYRSKSLSKEAIMPEEERLFSIHGRYRGKPPEPADYVRWLTTDRPRNVTSLALGEDLDNPDHVLVATPEYTSRTPAKPLLDSTKDLMTQNTLLAKELHGILSATDASLHTSNLSMAITTVKAIEKAKELLHSLYNGDATRKKSRAENSGMNDVAQPLRQGDSSEASNEDGNQTLSNNPPTLLVTTSPSRDSYGSERNSHSYDSTNSTKILSSPTLIQNFNGDDRNLLRPGADSFVEELAMLGASHNDVEFLRKSPQTPLCRVEGFKDLSDPLNPQPVSDEDGPSNLVLLHEERQRPFAHLPNHPGSSKSLFKTWMKDQETLTPDHVRHAVSAPKDGNNDDDKRVV